jgi:hypothetical protein
MKRAVVAGFTCGLFGLGVLVGAAGVYYRSVKPLRATVTIQIVEAVERDAYIKYRYGSCELGRKALLDYAGATLTVPDNTQLVSLLRSRTLSPGLAYARVAVLAERCGQGNDGGRYFTMARRQFENQGEHFNEAFLRQLVRDYDSVWDQLHVRDR